ncbi:MAG: DNA-binding protein [Desulfurococcaceae archaeon]|nr:DNA-binding protein [Desulfurococcaceae archaeon]
MVVLVIPIKPVFAYRIFTGRKKYDLRKARSGFLVEPGNRVVLYVSGGVKAFMGEYTVGEVITGSPGYVIREVSRRPSSGVGEEDFSYIRDSKYALAMEVLNPIIYRKPIEMKEVLRIIPDYNPPLGIQKLDDYEPLVVLLFNKARGLRG